MYDYVHPASLGARDVIAAWLVCLAIVVGVFAYPGFFPEPARHAHAALKKGGPAVSPTEMCAARSEPLAGPRG